MNYNVSRANNFSVANDQVFFLDANIWINILAPQNKPNPATRQYQRIFNEIIGNKTCKILLPSLLISEIINRIMKGVNFITFANKNGVGNGGSSIPSNYYKEIYRPSPEFANSYQILIDDFISYKDSIELINDGFGTEISIDDIFLNPNPHVDFNDGIYMQIARHRNCIVVTDDRDFWIEDVRVITQNQILIQKADAILMKGKKIETSY